MSDRDDRLENKVDKIGEDVSQINVNLVAIRKDLNYHIKRTDILEKQVAPMHVVYRAMLGIVGLSAFIASILEIMRFFHDKGN